MTLQNIYMIFCGLAMGVASGAFGIGGGLILIPLLVFLFGFSQHEAQGTSLAVLVLPIGLLGAYRYYQEGNVRFDWVLWLAMGALLGAYLGAHFVQKIPELYLKRAFGVLFLLASIKLLLAKAK